MPPRHLSGTKVYFWQKYPYARKGVYPLFRHFSNTFELSEILCERFGYDWTDFSCPRPKRIRQRGDMKDLDWIFLLQKKNILYLAEIHNIGEGLKCQNWFEMGLEWTIWGIETRKMIVRVPGAFLDHSRTPKPPKNDQTSSKNLFGVPRWGYLLVWGILGPWQCSKGCCKGSATSIELPASILELLGQTPENSLHTNRPALKGW